MEELSQSGDPCQYPSLLYGGGIGILPGGIIGRPPIPKYETSQHNHEQVQNVSINAKFCKF